MATVNVFKTYRWEFLLGLLYLLGVGGYMMWVRDWIPSLLDGSAPTWFRELVATLYPRFLVEKQRFDIAFFTDKADQVLLRMALIVLCSVFFSVLRKKSQLVSYKVSGFWNAKSSLNSIAILRKVYVFVMLIYIADWCFSLIGLSRLTVFYEPILLFGILHIPLASEGVMLALIVGYALSLCVMLWAKWTWQACLINSLLFLLFQGYFQCFGKIAHTFTPFVYAALLMPFLLFEENKARKNGLKEVNNWALRLIQLAIATCYLFSGLEKLLISQFDWLKANTLVDYITMHQAPVGLWLIQFNGLVYLLTIGALVFQLGFIFIVFKPKLRYIFLPMGLLFHWGTFLFLGIGWWIHPWQVAYLFFVDWSSLKVGKRKSKRWVWLKPKKMP